MSDNRRDSSVEMPLEWKTNPFGDRYIEIFAGTSFESASATPMFQRRFGNEIFHDNTLYVIAGSDSGLLPRHIIAHGLPKGSRYLFIELAAMKSCFESGMIPESLADRIVISDQQSWAAQAREMALANYAYTGRISYVRSIAVQQNSHPGYASLTQAVAQELMHMYWLFAAQFDEHVFTKTQLTNLTENRIPAITLKDKFKGNSAIILAAGPSLDKLLPWIMAHRNEAVIIAVSRISNRLLQAGIEPDIVISVDPQFISFSVSKEMFKFGDKTLFVHSCSASPLLVGQWPHRSVFAGPRLPWHEEGFININTIAPTVTNNAILLAQELGCSQVILAGVDLCYSADGYTHASGTKEHAAGPMLGNIDHTVVTNSGNKAETNTGYYEALKTIERQALEAADHGCTIINPAADAARMEGVEHIPPEQIAITKPLQQPAWQMISTLLDDDSAENRRAHYQESLALMDKALEETGKIKVLANEALECNREMAGQVNSKEYLINKIRMDRIENELDHHHESMTTAIKRNNAENFAKVISAESGEEWSAEELFHKTDIYYQAFIDGANALASVIEATKRRILSRIEEESPTPRFELMFKQWVLDIQFGRSEIWRKRHPQIYTGLVPGIQESFKKLERQFDAMLATDDANLTAYFQDLSTNQNTIGAIISNARSAFDKNDPESLRRIADGLSQRNEPLAQQATLLVRGFIQELEQDYKSATDSYYAIDEATSKELWQIGLERILSFSMAQEEYTAALATLQLLADRIISYQPFYAQLLALTGDITSAIEIYTKYLLQKPRDLNTMQALGLLLAEVGANDAALSALTHIKQLDPAHPGIEQLEKALNR